MQYAAVIDTPLPGPGARIGIRLADERLCGLDMLGGRAPLQAPGSRFADRVVEILRAYFIVPGRVMPLPMQTGGTVFQHRVWRALSEIPCGGSVSYGELAQCVGDLMPGALVMGCF